MGLGPVPDRQRRCRSSHALHPEGRDRPGLIALTFTLQGNQARIYLPDDVAPGEKFSGALEGQPNYV